MNDALAMTRANESRTEGDTAYKAVLGAVLERLPGADEGWVYDLYDDGYTADEIVAELMTNYESQQ